VLFPTKGQIENSILHNFQYFIQFQLAITAKNSPIYKFESNVTTNFQNSTHFVQLAKKIFDKKITLEARHFLQNSSLVVYKGDLKQCARKSIFV